MKRGDRAPDVVLDREISVLCRIGAVAGSSGRRIFKTILQLIREAVDYHSATLFLVSRRMGGLKDVASVGIKVDLIESVHFDLGPGFSAWVAEEKRPIIIPILHRKDEGGTIRSFLSIPLLIRDELIGVLNLGHRDPGAFDPRILPFMKGIAVQAATTIERVFTEIQLRRRCVQLERAYERLRIEQQQRIEVERIQAVSQIVASLNHGINNPLTTITGNAQFLRMTLKEADPSIRRRLEVIENEATRIANLTRRLRNIKSLVVVEYLAGGEKMIDVERSAMGMDGTGSEDER
ncbi:MAG TPA: GAF domain-containing protein [Candidatus Latescibacteria bacterium]|nr:GAF domain-containing protein [Candidatus Latescibacterota bacterium]